MQTTTEIIIVDADGLIALMNEDDINHKKAVIISSMLIKQKTKILVPITALSEAITVAKWKLNKPHLVETLINMCINKTIEIIDITKEILPEAISYFNSNDSKHNTFFDAIIAAITKEQKADAIFSFDKWYKKQGFTLASEL